VTESCETLPLGHILSYNGDIIMPNYSSWTHSKLRCVVFIQVCTMYNCVGPLKYIDKQEKKTDTLGIYANVSLNVTERRVATVNVYTCTKKDCSAE